MRSIGFSEQEVRRHSPEWAQAQWDARDRRRRTELADQAAVIAQATAAGYGSYEGAADDLRQMVEVLTADPEGDESLAWLTDPNAKTDLNAFRQQVGEFAEAGMQIS